MREFVSEKENVELEKWLSAALWSSRVWFLARTSDGSQLPETTTPGGLTPLASMDTGVETHVHTHTGTGTHAHK